MEADTVLDRVLPEWQSRGVSRPNVCASPDPFVRALHAVTLSDRPLARELVVPRGRPQPVTRHGWTDATPKGRDLPSAAAEMEPSTRAVMRSWGQRTSRGSMKSWRRNEVVHHPTGVRPEKSDAIHSLPQTQ